MFKTGDAEIPAETVCNSTGWGLTSGGGLFPPNALQWVQIPVHSHEQCQETFTGIEITNGMVCAGGPGASACNVSSKEFKPGYSNSMDQLWLTTCWLDGRLRENKLEY